MLTFTPPACRGVGEAPLTWAGALSAVGWRPPRRLPPAVAAHHRVDLLNITCARHALRGSPRRRGLWSLHRLLKGLFTQAAATRDACVDVHSVDLLNTSSLGTAPYLSCHSVSRSPHCTLSLNLHCVNHCTPCATRYPQPVPTHPPAPSYGSGVFTRVRSRSCSARYDPRQALTAEPWWPAEACRLTLARAARNGQRLQSLLGPRSTCGQRLKVSTPGRRVDAMRSRKDRHSTPAACSMRHISRVSGANRLAACWVGVVAFEATGSPLPMVRVV